MSQPSDLADAFVYFFKDPTSYSEESRQKNWKPETGEMVRTVANRLRDLNVFDEHSVEEAIRASAQELGIGAGKLIHPLRLCLTGQSVGPGLFELMAVLGKATCLRRIEKGIVILAGENAGVHE
jgi:glutamyl-tRNA synthetase